MVSLRKGGVLCEEPERCVSGSFQTLGITIGGGPNTSGQATFPASGTPFMSMERIKSCNTTPPSVPPPGFKELIRTIWSLMRPNRVLIGF